ncbi:hypothetical protein V8E51_017354 [Hyaloscypha variabilis]
MGLALFTTPGIITRTGNVTRGERDSVLDLVWGDHGLRYSLTRTEAYRAQDYFSDHLPIISHFELPSLPENLPRHTTNAQARKSNDLSELKTEITNIRDELPSTIDGVCNRLIKAISTAIHAFTPDARITKRSVPGFPPELKQLVRITRRAKRRASRKRTTAPENKYRRFKRDLKDAIRKLVKGIKNRGNRETPHTANLHLADGTTATTPEQKADAPNAKFHPPPVIADTSDIDAFTSGQKTYLRPLHCPTITK